MASQASSLLALVLLFTTINGSFAGRNLLDTTAAPEATPAVIPKPTIPVIPTTLPPMPSIIIPKVTIPTTIPTTMSPMPSIPTTIPTIPITIPTALPPMPTIPTTIPSIPTSIPKVPGLQMPPIPFMAQPPSTTSP